ncbi:AarF/ABC1/UbiB kinase family protein [Ferrovibrio sp.]|uniref:ABC1 kinase family protein n=1 Tax=Ferrovibrio sp. TaxID=1917215 RepID=UPI0025C6ABBC|nr:AarF/ABC1/UbiB kinase family protein [Ferrovibrio sp.]MBX3455950.1 AarF/ABC1/UbiB kinase family protein [Ferrovibrio sp.]
MAEDDSAFGRARRYARVGASVGGLAAKLGAERMLGVKLDRSKHANDLRQALGGLKGPLMKVAQIMSTIPDALPKEYVQELAQLQANAPAMGPAFVKRRMVSELGPGWEKRFQSFDLQAAAAASLGQVHKAVALDGSALAVKLQYPDMASAVEADLRQLKLIFAIYGRIDPAIDTRHIHAEIADRLREELDYEREAAHMRLYGAMLADESEVHIPVPQDGLVTKRLLGMNWLQGRPLLDYKDAPQEVRDRIAYNLFRAWYVPFYRCGVIHGDPHLGNYTIRDDLGVNLLDFGCVRIFPPKFVGGVIDLYRAISTQDRALAVHAYETWGFAGLSNEVIDTLNLWAEFVYAPLLEDRPRRIQEMEQTGLYGREVAEKVHAELKKLGGVTPPREFVFMDRAAVGLGGVFLHLNAAINWHRLFHDLIEGFDTKGLARRQAAALKAAEISITPESP